ncbi:MAG: zinc-binding dehydrogenase [Planctomycetes bacterium]|nr:zinc-binding dehydrogenase [Planctomycetota bacterium]
MKAILISAHGGTDQLKVADVPTPDIKPTEVLLRVATTSINHLDIWVRKGVPGHTFPLPMIPGCDMAGTVERCGALVTNVKPGDRVAVMPGFSDPLALEALAGEEHLARDYGIFGETRNGGCAEFTDIPAANLLPIPADMTFENACAIPLAFLTAWSMLNRRAQLKPGEDVLIHAAGSGVSAACIQIARLLGAGRIFVTAGSDKKLEKALALGADMGINYSKEDFVEVVRKQTGKRGVDVVVDHVGPQTFNGSLKCLRKGGRLVTCGATTGGETTVNLRLIFFKSLSILGSTMGPKSDLLTVWKLAAQKKLHAVVDKVFPVREIAVAHEYVESRQAFGKVVLDIRKW